jgi:hypothetical protein
MIGWGETGDGMRSLLRCIEGLFRWLERSVMGWQLKIAA